MVNNNNATVGEQVGLISYLAKLGLGEADLTKVMSLLQTTQRPDESPAALIQEPAPATQEATEPEWDIPKVKSSDFDRHQAQGLPPTRTVRLFLAEEQQILKEAYQSFFNQEAGIELLASSYDTSAESLIEAAREFQPNVMLLGVKMAEAATVEKLEKLRESCPDLALVLLFAFYDNQGIKALREFSKNASSGSAYLLKHTIDTAEQLTQVILSVAKGRIIIDPMVMEGLIRTGEAENSFLRELSPRELEVLSWTAKGYRNDTIADVLSCDVKTVERHINNIYSNLHNDKEEGEQESRHPRVRAALTYLKATGMLPNQQFFDD